MKFDTFEGPLDLLLHLVNQYEIDIYEVPFKGCRRPIHELHTYNARTAVGHCQ